MIASAASVGEWAERIALPSRRTADALGVRDLAVPVEWHDLDTRHKREKDDGH